MKTQPLKIMLLMALASAAWLLTACGVPQETALQPGAATETQPSPTEEILPTATATQPPGKLVLVAAGEPLFFPAELGQRAAALAAESGLLYEERPALQVNEIGADWQVVVLARPDPTLPDALAAHPGVQFIVVSDQELALAPNLSVIRLRMDYQAFMAGYLSILITPDWRTGAFFTSDDAGSLQEEAFIKGAQYFCGVCSSKLSPIVRFPVTARLAENAAASDWQAAADAILTNIVYVMYVGPGASSPDLIADLAQRGVVLVGAGSPPEALRSRWAATVSLDVLTPFETALEAALQGQGGQALDTPVQVLDINEEFYSSGRQRLVVETQRNLEGGWIYPLNVETE